MRAYINRQQVGFEPIVHRICGAIEFMCAGTMKLFLSVNGYRDYGFDDGDDCDALDAPESHKNQSCMDLCQQF